MADASDVSLRAFVCEPVVPRRWFLAQFSIPDTDGWRDYNHLSECGNFHKRMIMRASYEPVHVAMPGAHRIASLLKRWVLGAHLD